MIRKSLMVPSHEAIRATFDFYHQALISSDSNALCSLLHDDFSIVLGGECTRRKKELLDLIESHAVECREIEISETLSVDVASVKGTVYGYGVFHATVNGLHAAWRLRFNLKFSLHGGEWGILKARYIASSD
ncbi:nuclear transport factor 2 family protein [Pseudomonas sp. RIT-To-2]|uniref:nuclear transport factor 2 family protein n=1 Tax=Pseudomonas sp. RIT-To-2 TaxID=3462541 RepID=UPI002413CC9B